MCRLPWQVSQEVMAFTAKMNSKLPKEPIQTTEGDLKLLLKYKVCGCGWVCTTYLSSVCYLISLYLDRC